MKIFSPFPFLLKGTPSSPLPCFPPRQQGKAKNQDHSCLLRGSWVQLGLGTIAGGMDKGYPSPCLLQTQHSGGAILQPPCCHSSLPNWDQALFSLVGPGASLPLNTEESSRGRQSSCGGKNRKRRGGACFGKEGEGRWVVFICFRDSCSVIWWRWKRLGAGGAATPAVWIAAPSAPFGKSWIQPC